MLPTFDDFNYRISIMQDGIAVRAWHYEVPHTDEYAFKTKVDPREDEANMEDTEQMIRLGVYRVNALIDDAQREAREAHDDA